MISTSMKDGYADFNLFGSGLSGLGYTPEQCQMVFNSPIFVSGERPKLCGGEAAYWIPLLLLHTGARREEIAQLTKDRVRVLDSIHYIALDTIDDDDSLKTHLSTRAVPIHSQLIKIGFLDYLTGIASGRLFPELEPNERGQYGANWGDWWTKYIRNTVGIKDKKIHACHSFRHMFTTECRSIDMRQDYERTLVGHVGGVKKDDHDEYGEHLIQPLAAAVNRISFRGLDLSHLWKYE
jgi:integrase